MGNAKNPHKSSVNVKFYDVTLGDHMKASSHQFDFFDTTNGPSKVDTTGKGHYTDGGGNTSMVLTNLYKKENVPPADVNKVLSITNPYLTQKLLF